MMQSGEEIGKAGEINRENHRSEAKGRQALRSQVWYEVASELPEHLTCDLAAWTARTSDL
jgi:hypothetical protein